MPPKAKFINAPAPKESEPTPYKNDGGGNPVLSGTLLVLASKILSASTFVQQILWKLNKFDKLKVVPGLDGYNARYDATVIPIIDDGEEKPVPLSDLPKSRPRKNALAYYTSADYQAVYSSGKITPVDVVEYLLPLIQRDGKDVSKYAVAYLSTNADLVRAAAAASAERHKAGQPLSQLDGVPVAVKDEVDLKGYPKSLGSRLDFKDEDVTSWCVQKWEEAGAIVIGKTNMHELGLDTTNNNPVWGTPLNPHNKDYYTGGSSGGSACTVAQGICPIALGVDGGGSIRIPSAFCGLWGLKPGLRRVSDHPSADRVNTVAVSGPMCSNIDDMALAYRIMAQPNPQDPANCLFPDTSSDKIITAGQSRPKVIGIYRDWVDRSEPVVLDLFNRAVQFYREKHGYQIIDISLPLITENQMAFSLTILAESMLGLTPNQVKQLTHPNQLLLNVSGTHATAQDLLASQQIRERTMRHLAWLWESYPGMLLLTPTTPCAGWKIAKPTDITDGYGACDSDMSLRSMEFTTLANWSGCPAISCPLGYAAGNVPVGIMATGEWGSEEQLIDFGRNHEDFLGEDGTHRPTADGDWVDVLSCAKRT